MGFLLYQRWCLRLFAALFACLALCQTQPKLEDGRTVQLGTPKLSMGFCQEIAAKTLLKLDLKPGRCVTVDYRSKVSKLGSVGSKWCFAFQNGYVVDISAQTGKVMLIAHRLQLEHQSRLSMYRRVNNSRSKLYCSPPKFLLGDPSMMLVSLAGNPVKRLRESAGYYEVLPGSDPSGILSSLTFSFNPQTGKLIGFSRSVDYELHSTEIRVGAHKAQKLADQLQLPVDWGRAKIPGPAPKNAISKRFYIRPQTGKISEFTNEVDDAFLVWSIREQEKEVFVNVADGNVVGGWFVRTYGASR